MNDKIQKNKDLYLYLTLKTHVTADNFLEAKTREDLIEGKKYSIQNNLPLFMLGGGSNMAVVSDRIPGLTIKNNYKELKVLEDNKESVVISVS